MKSKRTKTLHTWSIVLFALQWICFIIAGVLIVLILTQSSGGMLEHLKATLGATIWSFVVSNAVLIALAFIAKDKIKPLVWMCDVILSNIVFGSAVMYGVFAFMLLDTYVITPLYKHVRVKYLANVEIDKRC